MNNSWKALLSIGLASSVALFGAVEAKNDNPDIKVVTSKPKLSKAFRDLARPLPVLTPERKEKMAASGEKVPGIDKVNLVPNRGYPFAKEYLEKYGDSIKDPVLQTGVNAKANLMPASATIGVGFDGMGNVTGAVPPDTNADVGPNHIVQTVNTALSMWDKAGNELVAPTNINALWAGFGGLCESTNRGDPIVLYDSQADRWLISQFAFPGNFNDNRQCIAISQTGDPTGAYHLYDFLYSPTKFNDYPHYGVWTDAYYSGVNQFNGQTFAFEGSGVVAYERDKMLLGQPAQQVIFDMENTFPNSFTPMPADIDGIFLPPSDTPGIFATADGSGEMSIFHFDVDWANPANSTFTMAATVNVDAYNGAVCGFSRDCIDQPNSQNLDAISQRMMFRMAYRNLNGQGKLVANHTVVGDPGDTSIAGVRWYEFDLDANAMPTLANNGTFNSGDGNSSWMGSAAMDAVGNIGVAYSVSGPTTHPSIRFTGRSPADPANTLTLPEMELKAGEGSQNGANRWGDYSSLSIDPVDDCTMWYTTEYYKAENDNSTGWSTYIGSFKFDDCVAGPAGEIAGTVTDSSDGSPIAGALVQIGALTVTTDADGNYSATLPVTDVEEPQKAAVPSYEVTVNRYGWNESTSSGVLVLEDETTDVDFALDPATPATVTGTVTDGSGLGHPLYAEIMVSAPGETLSTFTDPVTGMYSIDLFEGTLVNISATAVADGYMSDNADILPENTPVQDFALMVMASCTADGYEFLYPAFAEQFEGGVPSAGWSVTDTGVSGAVWHAEANPYRGINIGSGNLAVVDSDAPGPAGLTESTLVSPVITVADLSSNTLTFESWARDFLGSTTYTLDINVDGGGWTVLHNIPLPNAAETVSVDLAASIAGATSFQLRWSYNADWAYYVAIDDVQIGVTTCIPRVGSIVQGLVTDANTSMALNGAMVMAGADSTMTMATPEDDSIGDGYFSMFVADAETDVMVSKANYLTATVAKGDVDLTMPIALEAGLLDMAAMLDMDLTMGRMESTDITLNNTGGADANYTFMLAMMPPAGPVNKNMGPFDPSSRHFGPKALAELDTKKIRFRSEAPAIAAKADVEVVGFIFLDELFPWGMGFNQDTGNFWVSDTPLGDAGATDTAAQYDSTGVATGNTIDTSSFAGGFGADMAYNNRTGMMWQVGVINDSCIHEMDPVALTATGNTICPAFGTSQRGLAYDPLTNTFYSGSWNDSVIHQFMTDGTIIRSVNVGLPVSGLAINPVTNRLYVMANGSAPLLDVYELDASTPNLVVVDGFNYPANQDFTGDGEPDDLLPSGQSGLAIDCDGNLWTPSRAWGVAVGVATGDSSVCDWKELPWLKLVNGNSGMIAAMSSDDVAVEFNATELEAGTYQAQLIATNDTPYGDVSSVVTLNVTEPEYGMLGFSTTSAEARNGESINVTVSRTGGADYAVSVDYFTTDGTAIAGTNYTANSGTLMWADGDMADKTITINTLNTKQKVDRGLSVALTNVQGGASVGTAGAAVVVKRDKKGGGSFGLGILLMLGLAGLARRRKYA